MKTYCAFNRTSTNLCSVWEYDLLAEILIQETSNLRWMLNIFMNFSSEADFMKYRAIKFLNQKIKYCCKISRAKTCFNFLNPFSQKRSLPIYRLLIIEKIVRFFWIRTHSQIVGLEDRYAIQILFKFKFCSFSTCI